jgi:hypothetical protein
MWPDIVTGAAPCSRTCSAERKADWLDHLAAWLRDDPLCGRRGRFFEAKS